MLGCKIYDQLALSEIVAMNFKRFIKLVHAYFAYFYQKKKQNASLKVRRYSIFLAHDLEKCRYFCVYINVFIIIV